MYFDNPIFFLKSFAEHRADLTTAFLIMKNASVTLRQSKSKLYRIEVDYLERIIKWEYSRFRLT